MNHIYMPFQHKTMGFRNFQHAENKNSPEIWKQNGVSHFNFCDSNTKKKRKKKPCKKCN